MKIDVVLVTAFVHFSFISVGTASSFLLEDFHVIRSTGKVGDTFTLPRSKRKYDRCGIYGANLMDLSNETYTCQCPSSYPTFWFNKGKWKCSDDKTIRSLEGCRLLFVNETDTSPLSGAKVSFSRTIKGIHYDGTNSSKRCGLVPSSSGYSGCKGPWVSPKLNKDIWKSFSFRFSLPSRNPVLKVTDPISSTLKGKLVKMVFSDECVLSTNHSSLCLIFKTPGETLCRQNVKEEKATDPSLKENNHSTESIDCRKHWNKELLLVVVSAVSVVVLLIVVIIVLVVILQRRRMKEELIKVLREMDLDDNTSIGSQSRHYVDMSGAHGLSEAGVREQSTQTENFLFTFQGEEPDYASIRKRTTYTGHYYNVTGLQGPEVHDHDYATLRWQDSTPSASGKVQYYNTGTNKDHDMKNSTCSNEEEKKRHNTATNKGGYQIHEQDLMAQLRKVTGNQS